MEPREFEELVRARFEARGYHAELTPATNDYGVDVIAVRGAERVAIQAKMYGGSSRKVNRHMVMELHGAKDYFDCTKAVLATDGQVLADAEEVAEKLGIEVLWIDTGKARQSSAEPPVSSTQTGARPKTAFDDIWREYVMPLQGSTLTRDTGV